MKIFVQITGEAKTGKTELLRKLRKVINEFAIQKDVKNISITMNETSVKTFTVAAVTVEVPDAPAGQEITREGDNE